MTSRRFLKRGVAVAFAVTMASIATATAQTAPSLAPEVAEYVSIDAPVIALRHVQLVDGTGAAPRADQTVVIADGAIVAVGPSAEVAIPTGAETHDLTGHTVIPGIVGLHNHTLYVTRGRRVQLSFSAPRLYLGSGVTTIRTTGSFQPYAELSLAAAIERGEAPGPRMHVTGPHLTGARGRAAHVQLSGPEDARRVAAYWAEEGVSWLKVYNQVSRAELAAIVEEAHARGVKVTGHLCSVSFAEAVELGIDNIEHGFGTSSDFYPDKVPDECPAGLRQHLTRVDPQGEEAQVLIQSMVEAGVPMTSTLAVYETFVPGRPPLEDRVVEAMAPEVWNEVLSAHQTIAANADQSLFADLFPKQLAFERAFVDAGGVLAAGVDATGIGLALPGFGDQRNYELLLEAGFSPSEVIRIMTLNGATVLGEDDEYGSVEAGKRADLVVIDGDPLASPVEIRNVVTVFKDGVGYDSRKLIDSVRGQVGLR